MTLSIRPLALTDREELAALVEANLSALEGGLSVLERRFPAGQVPVDLVAVDARERLVLVILGSGSNPAMLLQSLEAYAWCRENGALLGRLLPGVRIDPAAPPRLFLLAPRFSDSLRRTARYLGPLSPVLVECRCLEVNGERGICFEPVEGDVEAAAPPEPVPPAPGDGPRERVKQLVSHLERLSFGEAFR
ncbi:MAG: hypothetical protein HYY64_12025 [Candidatus Rokubacteria bacterium]|nr:hypothetical protein [Candidatus Rokubacteria bacterium]